jgi:hypothetical protein
MAGVLTTASNVTCGHSGSVNTSSSAKLTVGGKSVLLKSSIEGKTVGSCSTQPSTDPSGAPQDVKCLTVSGVTAGEATKLTAGGSPVVLDTLAGSTDGMVAKTTPQQLLSATADQGKLSAV